MYGHRWSSTFGESFGDSGPIGQTWQAGLFGITPEMIAKGLHRCLEREDQSWPPTLPEFRALCVTLPPSPQPAAWVPQHTDSAKLPSPERLQWHRDNIAWVEKGGELPRPGVEEPPAPAGARPFDEVYCNTHPIARQHQEQGA